jgi:N-acetylglutamate synthase-like GNAT family acetyltransferase
MKEVILRPARSSDIPAVEKILERWREENPRLRRVISDEGLNLSPESARCTVLERENRVECVSLWIPESGNEIRLLALACRPGVSDWGGDCRFLQEEILRWTEMGICRVIIRLPQVLASSVVGCLRECGFVFEGASSSCAGTEKSRIRLAKYFLYKTIPRREIMPFLIEFMTSFGYEVRPEEEGFRYRLREDFRFPFMFSQWHSVSKSGSDIIVQPPARILERCELETLFYPLRIHSHKEWPLLVPLERKRAERLIELPREETRQKSLFNGTGLERERTIRLANVAYSYPAGKRGLRKGLPILFYVNRVGAVGTARAEDLSLKDPADVGDALNGLGPTGANGGKGHGSNGEQKIGKVLVLRFKWYRPLKKTVPLEEIRALDEKFNPQRMRAVPNKLYESILERGNRSE